MSMKSIIKSIIIRTQEELDALPAKFDEFTTIEIRGGTDTDPIIIRMNRENSRAVLYGNSHAELWGSSSAVLCENSRAVLHENSSAELWENSSAELWGRSSAELRGNSRVSAYDFSIVNVFSGDATIEHLADHSTVLFHSVNPKIEKKDETARVVKVRTTLR
jgi:hypothetical protein